MAQQSLTGSSTGIETSDSVEYSTNDVLAAYPCSQPVSTHSEYFVIT